MTRHAPIRAAAGLDPRPTSGDPWELCDWLQRRYVPTPRDADFVDALKAVLRSDAEGRVLPVPLRVGLMQETRGLAVIGPSGAGKSVMIRRNLGTLAGELQESTGLPKGVLFVTVPADATLKSLARRILELTGYPVREGLTKSQLWDLVRHRLGICGIGLVWIDEAHHLLVRRPGGDAASLVLRELKSLTQDKGSVAIILSGVPRLDDDLRADPETDRRFDRLRLAPLDDWEDRAKLARYVGGYCRAAQLTPVEEPDLAARLVYATDGSLGRSLELTLAAIRRALLGRRDALRLEDFARVFERQVAPGAVNPFDIPDWKGTSASLPSRTLES